VTIIAGFKCSKGVVLCADTQETVGMSKRNIPKLRFEQNAVSGDNFRLAAAFCGATNNGPFVDKLVDVAWKEAQRSKTIDDACSRIEDSIKRTYEEFGRIYPPGYMPEAELIYGVNALGASRLFSAVGPVVIEKDRYVTGGIGSFMADFVASKACRSAASIRQLVIIAAYVLFQAKENVDGCGGDSQIVILPYQGNPEKLDFQHISTINRLIECADNYLGDMVVRCSDPDKTEDEIKKDVLISLELFEEYRKDAGATIKLWDDTISRLERLGEDGSV
jgi:20S proteasome alpha/beta subunit